MCIYTHMKIKKRNIPLDDVKNKVIFNIIHVSFYCMQIHVYRYDNTCNNCKCANYQISDPQQIK